ncbi:Uncharacterised protein [uncultured archaeon]|nr:Uncharacterised protein [uncultured archaeon]
MSFAQDYPVLTGLLVAGAIGLSILSNRVSDLEQKLTPQTEVVSGRTNTYFNISGQKVYNLVDGKPATNYFPRGEKQ